jgi:hypothetical protein
MKVRSSYLPSSDNSTIVNLYRKTEVVISNRTEIYVTQKNKIEGAEIVDRYSDEYFILHLILVIRRE